MCIMCIEIQKDRMKLNEVIKALGEFSVPIEHEEELFNVVVEKFGPDFVDQLEPADFMDTLQPLVDLFGEDDLP